MPSHPSPNSAALFARLPPYLLSHVLEFGTDQDFTCLFRFGEVSRAFLEALAFVEVLHVDPLHLVRNGTEPMEYDDVFISHRYDTRIKRWCGLARARFKNVKRMHDGGGWGKTYNAAQTREIIDCAASFPHLTKLELFDTEPAAACASIAAHVRAGRFTRLECLDFQDPPGNSDGLPCFRRRLENSADAREVLTLALRDLFSHLPANVVLDIHLGGNWGTGLYPWLLERDDEYDTWRSELIELIDSRGADVRASPSILVRFLDDLRFVPDEGYNEWNHEHLERAYSTIEALLERGANPSLFGGWKGKESPLSCVACALNSSIDQRYPSNVGPRAESLRRMLVRILDLLLRNGAVDDSRPGLFTGGYATHFHRMGVWLLARQDCPPPLRQELRRRQELEKQITLQFPDEMRSGVRLADLRGIAEELPERLRAAGYNVPDVNAARMQCGPVCREDLADGVLNVGAVLRTMANRWGRVQENRH